MSLETIAAVNRSVVLRLERNLRFLSTLNANTGKHLTLLIAAVFPLVSAVTATNGLMLKALLRVKLLFPCGKDKILATILAY